MKVFSSVVFLIIFSFNTFAQKPGEWAWITGSNQFDQQTVWGSKSVFAPGNTPSNKRDPIVATDIAGNTFWLYGGVGNNTSGFPVYGSELWKFDATKKQWAWTNGSQTGTTYPVFGTKGVASAASMPGTDAAQHAVVDNNGKLWIYFGSSPNNNGNLWSYDKTTDLWTWMGGSGAVAGNYGVFGTKGVAAANNTPGVMSENTCMWVDKNNNLWMYCAFLKKATSKFIGIMWKFDQATSQWAWMAGDTTNATVYGTQGVFSAATQPGQAWTYCHWTDLQGNFWMFGGGDYGYPNESNSLWKFDPTIAQWAWMGGSKTFDQNGIYGTQGVASSTNWPGSRMENNFCWTDKCGNLWLFGGGGYPETGGYIGSRLDDLWMYNVALGQWTWKQGNKTMNQTGSYGTQGVFSPTNYPPSRSNGGSFTDKDGNFWLWGGDNAMTSGYRNDMWMLYTQTKTTATPATSCSAKDGTAQTEVFLGTAPYVYSWNSTTTTTTNSVTGLAPGSYTVSITDAGGCIQTDTFTIKGVNSNLQVSTVATTAPCSQNTATATANTSGGTTYTYTWAGANAAGQTTATATGLGTGFYTVTVGDGTGCTITSTVEVKSATSNYTLTPGSVAGSCGSPSGKASVAVTPNGNYTYSWIATTQTTSTATGLSAGIYTVVVADANGCSQTQSVTVTQVGAPTLTPSFTNTSCSVNTGTASVSVSPTSTYTYSWSTINQTTAIATGLGVGVYTVVVSDVNGCSVSQTISVSNNSTLSLIANSTPETCAGDKDGTAKASPSLGSPGYTYSWSDQNHQTAQTATALASGVYTVTVTDQQGCTKTATTSVSASVTVLANAGVDVVIAPGQNTLLQASGGTTYSWSPAAGLSNVQISNPVATPTVTTTYTVVVTDANGCSAFDEVIITIQEPCGNDALVFIPTAFSPNEDGINDVLYIRGGRCLSQFKLSVYNRWGELVFETQDKSVGWDGKYNGRSMDTAVFVYKLTATTVTGETIQRKGNLTLIR